MYLPQDLWSPRYDTTFYTVQIEGFERIHVVGDAKQKPPPPSPPFGNTHWPASVYTVVVYRGGGAPRTVLRRRYSQFVWLSQRLATTTEGIRLPPPLVKGGDCCLFGPSSWHSGCCGWPFHHDDQDAVAERRRHELADYLAAVLEQPALARHDAVQQFLELEEKNNNNNVE